jgi:hypothetical protein
VDFDILDRTAQMFCERPFLGGMRFVQRLADSEFRGG